MQGEYKIDKISKTYSAGAPLYNTIIFHQMMSQELDGGMVGGRWFPSQMPETRSFDVCFDLRLNKCSNKQARRRWFETLSRSL